MTLGDRIVIMRDGFIQQIGTPQEVFNHPANLFVAGFIGTPQMNFFDAALSKRGGKYVATVQGRDFELPADKQEALSKMEHVPSEITVGVRPVHIHLADDGIDAGALAQARASVLHITPFHSFPTGITTSAAKRSEYLAWAAGRDAILIEDDFDSEFSENKKPLQTLYSMDRRGCVIYINTFSHSLAPSMRMGYMVLPEALMARYREQLGFYSCSVPLFDQYVLARFISQGYFERHLNRLRRQNKGKTE